MIIINNRETREKMTAYAIEIWNKGNETSKEEKEEAIQAYRYDDNGLIYIQLLIEDIFEINRIGDSDSTAINLYNEILAHATKKGKKAIMETTTAKMDDLEKSYAAHITEGLQNVELENIDG